MPSGYFSIQSLLGDISSSNLTSHYILPPKRDQRMHTWLPASFMLYSCLSICSSTSPPWVCSGSNLTTCTLDPTEHDSLPASYWLSIIMLASLFIHKVTSLLHADTSWYSSLKPHTVVRSMELFIHPKHYLLLAKVSKHLIRLTSFVCIRVTTLPGCNKISTVTPSCTALKCPCTEHEIWTLYTISLIFPKISKCSCGSLVDPACIHPMTRCVIQLGLMYWRLECLDMTHYAC